MKPRRNASSSTGHDYIILDDTLSMGGTVIVISVIPETESLEKLRNKYEGLKYFWRQEFGYGFEGLTNSEANYLYTLKEHNADTIRDRIVMIRRSQGTSAVSGTPQESGGQTPSQPEVTPLFSRTGTIAGANGCYVKHIKRIERKMPETSGC